MKHLLLSLVLATLSASVPAASQESPTTTPTDVFTEVERIDAHLTLIQRHLGIAGEASARVVDIPLKPRHAWQKSYEILFKINILREQTGLPALSLRAMAPVEVIDPALTYEQTQRILTELALIERRLGIVADVTATAPSTPMSPMDVFNHLQRASNHLDLIIGAKFTSAHLFAEAMRIFEESNGLLSALDIQDKTTPPHYEPSDETSADALFDTGLGLLSEIARIQELLAVEPTRFYALRTEKPTIGELFGMTEMVLAELQPIKARLGLRHLFTPPAEHYADKSLAQTRQLLLWAERKLELIEPRHLTRHAR